MNLIPPSDATSDAKSSTRDALIDAQLRAEKLFAAVVAEGLICAGKSESELSREIHDLAHRNFGVRRHWHRKVVRAGENTLLTYFDSGDDRRVLDDDVVFLDFGLVFGEWEADFARTYVVGTDPRKHQLVSDLKAVFDAGKNLFRTSPEISAGDLYDFVVRESVGRGWTFGAQSAGHLIGHFPHLQGADKAQRFVIRPGNVQLLHESDERGAERHWILEVHLIDRVRGYGGFVEELLTI